MDNINKNNNLKDAIENYSKLIENNPNSGDLYEKRGNAKNELQDYDGAIEDFDKAIELNPDSAYLYEQRGDAKSSLESFYGAISDHYYDAIIDYNKAIELGSRNKEIYNKRGELKSILSDYREAIDDFIMAMDLDPEFVQAQENLEEAKTWLNDFNNRIKYQQRVINKLENIDKNTLYNPMEQMYKKGLNTLGYRDGLNLFDQIIMTYDCVSIDKIFQSYKFYKAGIFNPQYVISNKGRYKGYPFRSFQNNNYSGGYSDHFPVYIYLIKEE